MVYQLNIQTIPLTRRSHLIVRFPVADTAARVWSITAAVRRPRIQAACLSGAITSSLTLTTFDQDANGPRRIRSAICR
jgi:hypothetical protein